MRIGFIGDAHAALYFVEEAVQMLREKYGCEWICSVGDLGVGYRGGTHFTKGVNETGLNAAILGNRDEQNEDGFNPQWESTYGLTNVKQIMRGEKITVGGVTILGIGGADSPTHRPGRSPAIEGVDWWRGEKIQSHQVAGIDVTGVDIVVSHTAPTVAIQEGLVGKRNYVVDPNTMDSEKSLDTVLNKFQPEALPKFWIFGHWHTKPQYQGVHNGVWFIGLSAETSLEYGIVAIDTETMTIIK